MVPWSKSQRYFKIDYRDQPTWCILSATEFTSQSELSEYNLPISLKVEVVPYLPRFIPDKTWTGKISYVATIRSDAGQAGANAAGGTQGSGGAINSIYSGYYQ